MGQIREGAYTFKFMHRCSCLYLLRLQLRC